MISLVSIEEHESEHRDWEQNGHAYTIHHGHIAGGQKTRVLEVHNVVIALVQVDILADLGAFGLVDIL